LARSDPTNPVEFPGLFVDAAVSPADPSRIALLTRQGVAFVSKETDRPIEKQDIPFAGGWEGERIFWSPFGSAVKILVGQLARSFVEIAPNRWQEY
jgi:hypothetical protein